jgi:hypothetical protein
MVDLSELSQRRSQNIGNGQPVAGTTPHFTFTAWSANHASGPATADPDGDGRPNLVELLNGTLPYSAGSIGRK